MMKKYRIKERVFAIALVLCMVLTMMPANMNAATKGDVIYGDMGVTGINYDDKIIWPIEIFDYSNDGMLFEFGASTGSGDNWAQLDKKGEYLYMPDMTTDYLADFTTDKIQSSYVVTNWFPTWGHTNSQVTDLAAALKYYTFDATLSTQGGTELIDFRDKDSDGIEDCLEPIATDDGSYIFTNLSGYAFTITSVDGVIGGEDATVVTSESKYNECNPNWAVSVQLRRADNDNEYKVVKKVSNPESAANAGIVWEAGDIVLVVHSGGSVQGFANWKDRVAAMSLEEDQIVTVSSDYATVAVPATSAITPNSAVAVSKDDVKYAVVVYKVSDLEENGTIEPFLRDASGEKYFGSWCGDTSSWGDNAAGAVVATGDGSASDWRYAVLDFTYFSKASENEEITYSQENWWEEEKGVISNDIVSAGIRFLPDHQPANTDDTGTKTDSDGYQFMISHFAMFSTAEEAAVYGEKALVNNKHQIHSIYPKAEYSADYTTSEIAISKVETYWFNVLGITKVEVGSEGTYTCTQATDTNGRLYYNFDMFAGQEAELIDMSSTEGVDRDKVRYAALVYRVEGLADGENASLSAYARNKSQGTSYGAKNYSDAVSVGNSSTWGYQVFDFSTGTDGAYTLADNIYTAGIHFELPSGTSTTDYDFKVSHFALFESEEDAIAYGKQALVYNQYSGVPASYYNPMYSNAGYGFTAASQDGLYDKYSDSLGYNFGSEGTTFASLSDKIYYLQYGKGNSEDAGGSISDFTYDGSDMSVLPFDGYTLYTTLTEGSLTAGLLSGTLGEDGNPVYRDKTIDYLAKLLQTTLVIPEYTGGRFNYDFIRGEARIEYADNRGERIDLATAIRRRVGINFDTNNVDVVLGDIDSTKAKAAQLKGAWSECKEYVTSCYDAAYYLLSNIFVEGSYNEPQNTYDYLILNKGLTTEGKEIYFFDAGLSDGGKSSIKYDPDNKTIGYEGATGKALYYTTDTTTTTLFPFLPVTEDNSEPGMTKSPYFADAGVAYDGTYGETYWERDFNYVLKSSGEFVYHEEDGLFFDFEGDDDVYLFINGQLVLDIGGAHSITKQKINVNDYVNAAREAVANKTDTDRDRALNLEEGEVCTFDFFYMERHGYGANCRIATNLRVTDPQLRVEKDAYQGGEEINYGGVVDAGTPIEYNFLIENTGNTKLYNITFNDPSIGVSLDGTNGLIPGSATASDGSPLDVTDITAVVRGYKPVTDGTGNYIKNASGDMVGVATGEGDYIATENSITFESNDELKAFMATLEDGEGGLEGDAGDVTTETTGEGAGLWINSTLVIKGIYYKLTNEQKQDGYFNNSVYVTATTAANTSQVNCETLQSQATHRVYVPSQPYYYQWANHEIVILKEKLVTDIINAKDSDGDLLYSDAQDLTAGSVNKIALTTSNGYEITLNNVTIDGDYNITVNYPDAGAKVFYLKITYADSAKSLLVPVVINVTDVKDSYMVLDYGLTVELTEANELFKSDTVSVANRDTTAQIVAITGADKEPSYSAVDGVHKVAFDADGDGVIETEDGTYTLENNTLIYQPEDFMDGIDTIWGAVCVYETDFAPTALGSAINISHEVQMYKEISVLPANVVYYEDNFPAIKYKDEEGNFFTQGNTFTQVGSNEDLTQSPNQDTEYGRDDAYANDIEMSGGSITKITLGANGQVAYFDFAGTGFELVSRTNAFDSGKLSIKVKELSYDVNGDEIVGGVVKNIPVITEFDNGADGGKDEIYQVPVIRIDDLTYGTYRVYISGVAARDYNNVVNGVPAIIETTLYIDGLRIYNPLGENDEYYNDAEKGVIFQEIRNLIMEGKAAVAQYSGDATTVSYGNIMWTENRNGKDTEGNEFVGNKVGSVNDYLVLGPNNEVYMDGDFEGTEALVFYVNEVGEGIHSLQLALRGLDKGLFLGEESSVGEDTNEWKTPIYYGIKDGDEFKWEEVVSCNSATEQYYTIDYTKCPYIKDKGYQVAIMVTSGLVSYSSIKSTGLEFVEMTDEAEKVTLKYENGILVDATTQEIQDVSDFPVFYSIRRMLEAEVPNDASEDNELEENTDTKGNILYQKRNNTDLRLIAYVDDLTAYSSVSFVLTINGRESKELVSSTAYAGLYASGELKTTKDVYNKDGYMVTYVINGYMSAFAGEEVTIKVTYTTVTGEKITDVRTVTIE